MSGGRTHTSRIDAAALDRLAGRVAGGAGGDAMPVLAPFTGERLGAVPRVSAGEVAETAARARMAQRAWSTRPVGERAGVVLRFHDLVLDRRDEVLDLLQLETGKARLDALEEVLDAAIVARYYGRAGGSLLRSCRHRGALPLLTATWEHHRPVGVVGVITPWNYPLTLPVGDAVPALVAGNAVLVKPDAQTPFACLWAAELLAEAGLPPGLFEVVTGDPIEVGPALIDHVDHVAFTGSMATGRVVAARAAGRLCGASLELGGKNAMVVMPDAHVGRAVDGAVRGCFANAGQLCISTERLFVHESLFDDFVRRLGERTQSLTLGSDLRYGIDMGSLFSARQLERVSGHVDQALASGATLVAGGKARPDLGPCFYAPTLLSGVTDEMAVFAEETFGPVAAVAPFSSVEEVVERVNDSRYGLSLSLWSDTAQAGVLASRFEVGAVNVNEAYAAAWASTDAPFGGVKDSGGGRRHGAEGILRFTTSQTVATQRLLALSVPPGLSQAGYARLMSGALRIMRRLPGVR